MTTISVENDWGSGQKPQSEIGVYLRKALGGIQAYVEHLERSGLNKRKLSGYWQKPPFSDIVHHGVEFTAMLMEGQSGYHLLVTMTLLEMPKTVPGPLVQPLLELRLAQIDLVPKPLL